ncbi:potassium/proton antiporter [Halarcobacter mediterraneus]|uniref:Potassium/proton antiporter n=1 Tax=Halarcobacter mediterraneus TaxID=2023153 RepID=A0A4V1M130_9BACT|nr:potassium/proton antiporter [Halarcobacter mediterraneus]RXK11963.1 potassium/proton antiporter [Halarcobacter mediterraneus]
MNDLEIYLLVIAFLMLLSVLSSKLSDKFGIPVLFIFLGLGMIAGSEGILGIYFDNAVLAQAVGTIALIYILFGGGLDTQWRVIKPVLKDGLILATVGVFLTALFVAICVHYVLGFDFLESLLLGAIVSSTDAAAVFAILRAKGISLKKGLSPLLELESGSNDPMAIFLTVAILQIILLPQSSSFTDLILYFFLQFFVGIFLGVVFGILLPKILNKINFTFYGLYPVFTIAWVMFLFGIVTLLGGNGFLSVYIAGVFANKKEFVHKKNLIGFHDGLSWIMQISVFLTLGLLVFPSELPDVAWHGFLIALWLIFIARPSGIFLSLIFSKFSTKEKTFISWVGLRGAVPIVLATYPFIEGLENASLIFNTVFFIVLLSILLQGTTLPFVAKLLNLEEKIEEKKVEASPLFYQTLKQFYIDDDSKVIGANIAELQLPSNFLVLLIKRNDEYILPTGATIFEKDDLLLIQCDKPQRYKRIIKHIFK